MIKLKETLPSVDDVIEILQMTKGSDYLSSPHHFIEGVNVHIFRPKKWYVKFYFIEPNMFFISVHR